MQLEQLTKQYCRSLKRDQRKSDYTVVSYRRYLTTFFHHARITEPAQITKGAVQSFLAYLAAPIAGPGAKRAVRSASTQDYYRIALRSFLKYLATRNITALAPGQVPLINQTRHPQHQPLTPTEIARWRSKPDPGSTVGLRDRALIELMLATGFRVSVLCSLTRADCDVSRGQCTSMDARGGARVVRLSMEARQALRSYLKRRQDGDPALFVQHGTNSVRRHTLRLSPRSVERRFDCYRVAAGIVKPVTPKAVRQYVARELYRTGVPLAEITERLGHLHPMSTETLIAERMPLPVESRT